MVKSLTDTAGNVISGKFHDDKLGHYLAVDINDEEVCRLYSPSTYQYDDAEFKSQQIEGKNYELTVILSHDCVEEFNVEYDEATGMSTVTPHAEPKPIMDSVTGQQRVLKENSVLTYVSTAKAKDTQNQTNSTSGTFTPPTTSGRSGSSSGGGSTPPPTSTPTTPSTGTTPKAVPVEEETQLAGQVEA